MSDAELLAILGSSIASLLVGMAALSGDLSRILLALRGRRSVEPAGPAAVRRGRA